eukprot:g5710.t1
MRGIRQDSKHRRIRKPTGLVDLRDLRKRSVQFLRKFSRGVKNTGRKVALDLQSIVIRGVAATTGYTLGLFAFQAIGYGLRISCATPILSSCLGGIGVASASILAGQFAKCAKLIECGGVRAISTPEFSRISTDHVITDIILGVACYKLLGGRFRNLMPSDLCYAGAHAVESIPARSSSYATDQEKQILGTFFKKHGCHSCGTRSGDLIGDHIPPNKYAQLADPRALADQLGFGKQVRTIMNLLDIKIPTTAQRFYPQCSRCSIKQSHAVRMNRQVLVYHYGGPRAYHSSGAVVGIHEHKG